MYERGEKTVQKLVIYKLGPVEQCELECSHFMTFTGFQASGKSTIAKAIYYFRTIKEDIEELVKVQAYKSVSIDGMEEEYYVGDKENLGQALENHLRVKFLRTFGSLLGMSDKMYMEYYFTESCFVKVSLKPNINCSAPNSICITVSEELNNFLRERNHFLSVIPLGIDEDKMRRFKAELCGIFDDKISVVYIPAGRSMITLLSQQLSYIYATMDDMQKRTLDSCTKDYLERILRLKPQFSEGLKGLMEYSPGNSKIPQKLMEQALCLIKKILRGMYRYRNGEEQIVLDNGKYVKMNFSSSGQQECVWILNLLFYYLLQSKPYMFIIEEPESHLFPESQKYITEFIALVSNCGHSVLVTTHSPYVLGTLNNLLYAHDVGKQNVSEAGKIIPESFWLDYRRFDSWFVKEGSIENCMDMEIHMIQNERIDEISKVINYDFDELLKLQNTDEGSR